MLIDIILAAAILIPAAAVILRGLGRLRKGTAGCCGAKKCSGCIRSPECSKDVYTNIK